MNVDVRYAPSTDGTRIAWSVHGNGGGTPLVAMRPPQFSHIEREWRMGFSHHEFEAFLGQRRVLRFDGRGTGLSDRDCADHSIECRVADLEAALDAAGLDRVVLDAISAAGLPAVVFAARHPERVERLILQNTFIDGADWWESPNRRGLLSLAEIDWLLCTETLAWLTWPTGDRDGLNNLAAHIGACVNAADFLKMADEEANASIRDELAVLSVPTLVLANPGFARMAPQDLNREVAAAIRGASLVTVSTPRERVNAISAFLEGGTLAGRAGVPVTPAAVTTVGLSERELEVLRLIADGLSNREIADRLVLGTRTIDSHAAHIYQKTGTRGRAEATAFAIRHGLLEIQ